jgi:hypothetical protein
MTIRGNVFPGADQDNIDRLWDDLIKKGVIDNPLYLRLVARGLMSRRTGEEEEK